jgi:hypothetical protein
MCDIGFHYGSLGDNLETFAEASKHAVGLKYILTTPLAATRSTQRA